MRWARFNDDSTSTCDDDIRVDSSSPVHVLEVIEQRGQQLNLLVIACIGVLVVHLLHDVVHVFIESLVSLVERSETVFSCLNMSLVIYVMSVAHLASVVHLSIWFIEC